jgi:hypothetical protein
MQTTTKPTVEEAISIGEKRLEELSSLNQRLASLSSNAEDFSGYFTEIEKLSWIQVKKSIDLPYPKRSAFHLVMLEVIDLLLQIVRERGPGVLGYFRRLELSFSPRFGARYDPEYRDVRLNMGALLYANELETTYRWLQSLFFKETDKWSLDEAAKVVRSGPPSAVQEEFTALFLVREKGGVPVSGKFGLEQPIGRMILRFVIAHELGHLIDLGGSPKLQSFWRDNVWSDYDDALEYCRSSGAIRPEKYALFLRSSLDENVASQWASEFVADGLGFYMVSQGPPPGVEARLVFPLLQTAVEIFFCSLVAAYQGDAGTPTHPAPTLRSSVLRAGQRKLTRAIWPQFLAEYWGPGFLTAEILLSMIAKIGRKQ